MIGIKKKIRDNRYLNWILILSNWMLQGILHADRTEKIYKLSFTLVFWLIFFLFSSYVTHMTAIYTILITFVIAHSLNWLVNGNFYVLIIHRLMLGKLSKNDLFSYLDILGNRIQQQHWVLYAASFGSICKGKLKDTSDLDLTIVRKKGFKNAIYSILFAIKEKKLADFKGIPLEIYISDSPQDSIKRFGGEKNPVVIYDPENEIDKYYKEKLSIKEAILLNS